jgi:hypothetical protein
MTHKILIRSKITFAIWLILWSRSPAFAAFNATAIWRTSTVSGSNTNGGAFDPGVGSPGTDASTGAGVAITVTLVSGTTGTCSPSCSATTNGPGNFIFIASGSGCTSSTWFEILSQAAGTITVDKTMGSATDACVGTLGGPLATIAQAAALVVAGNNVCVKADGTYSVSANIAVSTAGGNGTPIVYQGYTSNCGVNGVASDLGQATVQASAAVSGIFTVTVANINIDNFILDNNSETGTTRGINNSGAGLMVRNVVMKNFATSGITSATGAGVVVTNSRATAGLSGCTAGMFLTSGAGTFFADLSDTNNCNGFQIGNTAVILFSISANNVGASSDGFNMADGSTLTATILNSLAYGNGRDGIHTTLAAGQGGIFARNDVFWGNSGKAINLSTALAGQTIQFNYNAYASGSLTNVNAGPNDVTLTGDPTIAGASLNFMLNSTAGAGAALKAAGFPGALNTGGTGYIDMGPLQVSPYVQVSSATAK